MALTVNFDPMRLHKRDISQDSTQDRKKKDREPVSHGLLMVGRERLELSTNGLKVLGLVILDNSQKHSTI